MPVRVSKLSNGITVVTEHMPHLESAALGIWVKAGARDERPEQHGIAHLLEHMAFKGTKTRSARQIAEEIESVGGDLNAATGVETTSFYARVLKDDVGLAIDILSDILTNSAFDERELAREQHVILQEIGAALDSPEDVVFTGFQETAFSKQAIGRSILGTPETVSGFKPVDIQNYLDEHYHGSNMVLSAAGAVDHDEIVTRAEANLASFSSTPTIQPVDGYYSGGELRIEKDLQEVHVLLGFEGRAYHVKDYYASQFLAVLLGGGMSSRLFQEIREKRGLCYSVYSFHWGFSDTGVFGIHAATGTDDVEELMPVLIDELSLLSKTIEQSEVDRARAQIRAGLLMSLESPAARAGQIASQVLLYGHPISNEELMKRIEAIDIDRLQDLSSRLFDHGAPTLAAIGPIENLKPLSELVDQPRARYSEAAQ